ncbi:early nodulin-75-like [Coregonus clupeaformis]|uniref:early nodulin-75-like n=1 Tax=Coregonus clupeaformis TaxID=59861 RepID=UPI001BE1208F|nr:early nodulin-75-like [Coregonus clupeaformis]
MTDARINVSDMIEARVRLTRIKVHNVTEARVRLTRVRVSDHVTEVKDRKARLSGTEDSQSDPRDTTVPMTTKHNGWLASGPGGSNLKNWGKFRIPKRSERPKEEPSIPNPPQSRPLNHNPPQSRPLNHNPPQCRPLNHNPPQRRPPNHNPPQGRPPNHNPPQRRPPNHNPPQGRPPNHNPPQGRPPNHNPPQGRPPNHNPPQGRPPNHNPPQGRPLHRTPPNTSELSYPRTRLRTGTESDGYSSATPETPPSGVDMEACQKRCHSHQLRGGAYGSDIIHQEVLAS